MGRFPLEHAVEDAAAVLALQRPAIARVVVSIIAELGAETLKDMGKVMNALKDRFPGRMDFGRASKLVKERLS